MPTATLSLLRPSGVSVSLTRKSSVPGSLTNDTNISYSTALRRNVIVPLVFRNCNFWKVFNTYFDFKLVTYNNCETGAAGPYIALAPFAWTFLPSGLLFLNYTKDIQTFRASLFVLFLLYYVCKFWLLILRRSFSKIILCSQTKEGLKPHNEKPKLTFFMFVPYINDD